VGIVVAMVDMSIKDSITVLEIVIMIDMATGNKYHV
jgi:hypothetical protein